jgi:hypothetical protein
VQDKCINFNCEMYFNIVNKASEGRSLKFQRLHTSVVIPNLYSAEPSLRATFYYSYRAEVAFAVNHLVARI